MGTGVIGSGQAFGSTEVQLGSIAVTVPAGGRQVFVIAFGQASHTAAVTCSFRIRQTNTSGTVLRARQSFVASTTASEDASIMHLDSPSAGAKTYVLTAQAPSAGGTYSGGFFLVLAI